MKRTAARAKRSTEYLKRPYSRVLIPEDEGGYSAEILEFPGCYSQGETPEEAMQNIEDAATNWIEATLEAGNPVPPPSANLDYAGKVALRLPRSLHRQAVRFAERDGVSLNQWLVSAVAARVGAEDLYGRLAEQVERRQSSGSISTDTPIQPLDCPSQPAKRGGRRNKALAYGVRRNTRLH